MRPVARSAFLLLLPFLALLAACGRNDAGRVDRLEAIRAAGVLRVAAFDGNPPFGFIDPDSNEIRGLDVDIAHELANRLGVKLELVPTNPANRIPLLQSRRADLVLANFTITLERAQQIDFSIPYFASGQQFLARKGRLASADQLNGLRIGVDKGTTNEAVLRQKYPGATLIAYDDTPFAFTALRNGNVDAITQDGPKLVGLLANVPDADQYEIPPFSISDDLIGIGIPRGEAALKAFVDETLLELEASGRAQQIHDAWFGPGTRSPLPRLYRIVQQTAP
jgi:polar amino acid transport system substrate-binding protein